MVFRSHRCVGSVAVIIAPHLPLRPKRDRLNRLWSRSLLLLRAATYGLPHIPPRPNANPVRSGAKLRAIASCRAFRRHRNTSAASAAPAVRNTSAATAAPPATATAARVAGRGGEDGGNEQDEVGELRAVGGGTAARDEANAAMVAPAPPRPTSVSAGCMPHDERTAPASPDAEARSAATKRTRSTSGATWVGARRRGTRLTSPGARWGGHSFDRRR